MTNSGLSFLKYMSVTQKLLILIMIHLVKKMKVLEKHALELDTQAVVAFVIYNQIY